MPAHTKPYPVVEFLIDIFGNWLQHQRELSEIRQLDRSGLNRIAGELRVSSDDLDALVRRGPHAADELPKLLQALGIDESDLARTEPQLLRDMERVCALCRSKRQCNRERTAGTTGDHYKEFCLNASTIDGLGQSAEQ
jgi:transcriptional regulator with XRE-family HTH domain